MNYIKNLPLYTLYINNADICKKCVTLPSNNDMIMNKAEWEQWKHESMETFERHYVQMKNDIDSHGYLKTRKNLITSMLYFFNSCNYEAAEEIITILENDANDKSALANYLLGYIYMYKYKGFNIGRNMQMSRDFFAKANELNQHFPLKQNP